MDDRERQRLLHEAIGDAVSARQATEAEARNARRHRDDRRNPALAWTAFVGGWILLGWIWVARPAWVFGPPAVVDLGPVREEARLRFALYLERNRVVEFQLREGRLPATLEEAGSVEEGVEYLPAGDSFAVEGRRGGLELRLTSRMDSDSFLGGSLPLLNDDR